MPMYKICELIKLLISDDKSRWVKSTSFANMILAIAEEGGSVSQNSMEQCKEAILSALPESSILRSLINEIIKCYSPSLDSALIIYLMLLMLSKDELSIPISNFILRNQLFSDYWHTVISFHKFSHVYSLTDSTRWLERDFVYHATNIVGLVSLIDSTELPGDRPRVQCKLKDVPVHMTFPISNVLPPEGLGVEPKKSDFIVTDSDEEEEQGEGEKTNTEIVPSTSQLVSPPTTLNWNPPRDTLSFKFNPVLIEELIQQAGIQIAEKSWGDIDTDLVFPYFKALIAELAEQYPFILPDMLRAKNQTKDMAMVKELSALIAETKSLNDNMITNYHSQLSSLRDSVAALNSIPAVTKQVLREGTSVVNPSTCQIEVQTSTTTLPPPQLTTLQQQLLAYKQVQERQK